MGADHTLNLREAVVTLLLADSAVAALVSTRVYGMQVPAKPGWPFLRYGVPISGAYESSCGSGSESAITVHAHAKGPGEDACATLAKAAVAALSADTLPLTGGVDLIALDWRQTQIIPDIDESGAFHAIINFDVITQE